MCACPIFTDDEMKYFQFKARQQFLAQKEDHEWNEYCKKNQCTCCSCRPIETLKPLKDVGIQVSAKILPHINKNTYVKTVQRNEFPDSLNDIRLKLDKINLTLSEIKQIPQKDQIPDTFLSNEKYSENDSAINLLNEQKKAMIKKSLITSLQKMHSFALQKSGKSVPSSYMKNKNRSFFLPPDLQKQRLIARNAYLSSLINKPTIKSKKMPNAKKNTINEKSTKKDPSNIPAKFRKKKSTLIIKPEEQGTLIQSENLNSTKDENVEKVMDNIVNELVTEEILSFNRIKQLKMKIQRKHNNNNEIKDIQEVGAQKINLQKNHETDVETKKNSFFSLRSKENPSSFNSETLTGDIGNINDESQQKSANNITNTQPIHAKPQLETIKTCTLKYYTSLHIDPNIKKEVKKQRKEFIHYLEKVSRSRTHNFDPLSLSNMVAESLLDDCIFDVCAELGNVPTSLVTDIINQEFTPMI